MQLGGCESHSHPLPKGENTSVDTTDAGQYPLWSWIGSHPGNCCNVGVLRILSSMNMSLLLVTEVICQWPTWIGGKMMNFDCCLKRISGAHMDHGRRPPGSPKKVYEVQTLEKLHGPETVSSSPFLQIAQRQRLQSLPCPIDAFSWSHGIPCPISSVNGFAPASWLPGHQAMEIVFWSTGIS